MKKNFWKIFLLVFALFLLAGFTACGDKPADKTDTPSGENGDNGGNSGDNGGENGGETKVTLDDVKFEDLNVTYDGKTYRPEVTGLPEGATVTYSPTKKQSAPGSYDYKATVKLGEESKVLNAKLVIDKARVTVNVEDNQVAYLTDGFGLVKINYSLSDIKAPVKVSQEAFTEAGTYKVRFTMAENKFYYRLEPVEVNFVVKPSHTGYELNSKTIVINEGETATLELEKGEGAEELDLTKYDVVYTNNTQTTQGNYQVKALVKEKGTEKVVDEFRAILTVDYPDNEAFQTYAEEMFVYFMGGDQSTNNIFFVHPENFGFEHYDAEWYTYEKYTDEEFQSDLEEIQRLRNEFNAFSDAKISNKQRLDYRIINEQITFYEELITSTKITLMRLTYVDQYGGYAADFPTVLEAYSLRTVQDIDDALSYVNSSYDAFMSYYEYILDRVEAGYPLAGFTLNGMADYLEGVAKTTESDEAYYLIGIYNEKLDAAKTELNLSDEALTNYKSAFAKAFNEKFIPAHADLAKKIRDFMTEKGLTKDDTTSYLYGYKEDGGVALYEKMLKNRLGLTETTTQEAIKFVDDEFAKFYALWKSANATISSNAEASKIDSGKVKAIDSTDPLDIVAFCKEFAKTIVPELENEPEISVTLMDKTVTANTTTLAYYMKSPLDAFDKEFIHINGDALGKNHFETLTTLAHEGYPGHLYAYCFAKESDKVSPMATIMTCTGHGEGWAKYVETCVAKYVAQVKNDINWEIAGEYENYYSLMAYLLESRIDLGVNYEGWEVKDVSAYLGKYGLNTSIAKDVFNTVNEAPTQIIAYGYGMAVFFDWHELGQTVLGEYYNEINFNVAMLEHGWCSLDTLDLYMEEYLSNEAFLHNVEYNK